MLFHWFTKHLKTVIKIYLIWMILFLVLVLGTALYVYNDAVFTTEDWNGIQEIARSRKREDPLKVGRFGIGFNSVYHITGEAFIEILFYLRMSKVIIQYYV